MAHNTEKISWREYAELLEYEPNLPNRHIVKMFSEYCSTSDAEESQTNGEIYKTIYPEHKRRCRETVQQQDYRGIGVPGRAIEHMDSIRLHFVNGCNRHRGMGVRFQPGRTS